MMKKLALAFAAALTLVSAAATAPDANACGDYGSLRPRPEMAHGQWASIARAHGKVTLALHYPRFVRSGDYLYVHRFEVVDDENLTSLARRLNQTGGRDLIVSVVEVGGGRWRVTGWTPAAARA